MNFRRYLSNRAIGALAGILAMAAPALAGSATSTLMGLTSDTVDLGGKAVYSATVVGPVVPTGTVAFTFPDGKVSASGTLARDLQWSFAGAGYDNSCYLTAEGGVKCWGANLFGMLGNGTGTNSFNLTPQYVTGLESGVQSVVADGARTACALTTAGGVKCWGYNALGQIGDGTRVLATVPKDVTGLGEGVAQIALAASTSCALLASGSVKCWGANGYGQYGNGTGTDSIVPTEAVNLRGKVKALTGGASHMCALTFESGVKCWGSNIIGESGLGALGNSSVPMDVAGWTGGIAQVDAGDYNTCAVTTAGAVFCTGNNRYGSIGDGTTTQRRTPVAVSGLGSGVKAVSVGTEVACALLTSGSVQCWGRGFFGQLGNGSTANSSLPVAVAGLPADIVAVSVGYQNACAVTSSGAVYCWGYKVVANSASTTGYSFVIQRTPELVSGLTVPFASSLTVSADVTAAGSLRIKAAYAGDAASYASVSPEVTMTVTRPVALAVLTSSKNPAEFGDAINLTATVTGASSTPTGEVRFLRDGVRVKTVALTAGKAILAIEPDVGTAAWTAVYGGDETFAEATSAALSQVVTKAASAVALAGTPNPAGFGKTVKFTATVTSTAGKPGGTVTFLDGSRTLGTGTLAGGKASFSLATLASGSHAITAVYAGSDSYLGATSPVLTQKINLPTTTTVLTVSAASGLVYGQPVTLTATVDSDGGATPTGTVDFLNKGNTIGTATLSGGKAVLVTRALPAGANMVAASYAGTTGFPASATGTTKVTVTKADATLTLAASTLHANPGDEVTLRVRAAAVSPSEAVPVGKVTFKTGTKSLGSVTLDAGGMAVLKTTRLALDAKPVIATIGAGQNFDAAKSAALTVVVDLFAGDEIRVNTTTKGPQTRPAVSTVIGVGAAVVWESASKTGADKAIVGRLVTLAGNPAGAEFEVAAAGAGVGAPAVSGLNGGNFAVVWEAGPATDKDVYMRLYGPTGTPQGDAVKVNKATAGNQLAPAIGITTNGGFFVLWQSEGDGGDGQSIMAQRYTKAGKTQGSPFVVNTTTAGDQIAPRITGLSNGEAVVGWTGPFKTGRNLFLQKLSATGGKVGDEIRIEGTALAAAPDMTLTPTVTGGYVAGWSVPATSATDAADNLFMAIYNGAGTRLLRNEINKDEDADQTEPVSGTVAGGQLVLAWTGPDAARTGILLQNFTAAGKSLLKKPLVVNETTSDAQVAPAFAPLAESLESAGQKYLIVWQSTGKATTGEDIYVRRLAAP